MNKLLYLPVIAVFAVVESSAIVVNTKPGPVRGALVQIPTLQDLYQFSGIPFAEPPVGDKRLRKPVYKSTWNGTLDATRLHNACVQSQGDDPFANFTLSYLPQGVEFSEDCLYLNIWVPKKKIDNLSGSRKLPVYVFIHGGGFVSGSPMMNNYNGSVFAARGNLIVATVAYRVGSLGFTYLGTEDAPGNQGLWDQQAGLRWIYENIESFGGNKSRITLAGESAGAASVTYHLLSPHSRPYIQQAIVQSGTAMSPWALYSKDLATSAGKRLLSQVMSGNCLQKTCTTDQLNCLRTISAIEFTKSDTTSFTKGYGFGAAPVLDGDFVPRDPKDVVFHGDIPDIPLLIGTDNDEGSMFLQFSSEAIDLLSKAELSPEDFNTMERNKLLAFGIGVVSGAPRQINPSLLHNIQLLYWPTDRTTFPNGEQSIRAIVEATGDYGITCPTLTWAQVAAVKPHSQVFVFNFNHLPTYMQGSLPSWNGVPHGTELSFTFGEPLAPYAADIPYSSDEQLFAKATMAYWANFAYNSDPNISTGEDSTTNNLNLTHWPVYSVDNCTVFQLDIERAQRSTCSHKLRNCMFWNWIFQRLGKSN